jgi:hypothetical protein
MKKCSRSCFVRFEVAEPGREAIKVLRSRADRRATLGDSWSGTSVRMRTGTAELVHSIG